MKISRVMVIYNPNSTGNGKVNALAFAKECRASGIDVDVRETEYAGHAVKIARDAASSKSVDMIVSSSGDGGYHEVVNGVLTSDNPETITGVLPSGNANDHFNFVHDEDIVPRILKGDVARIDVIVVETDEWTRYAHSYVGLGVTPQIGKVLTEHTLNLAKEALIVVTHLFKVHPVKIAFNGKNHRYDNIVFSNIGRMSKYLTLSSDAAVDDGQFEVTMKKHSTAFELIRHLAKAAISEADATQMRTFHFTVMRKTSIQLDGEVYTLVAGARVKIDCQKQKLRCIV